MKLADLIHQTRPLELPEEVYLNIVVTNVWVQGETMELLQQADVTPAQYNVLRILRGCYPEPATCSYIGARLLDRTPDVTRLLERMERQALILRRRADYDRRVVEVFITDKGLEILRTLDVPMQAHIRHQLRHLSEDEQQTLVTLLEKVRLDQGAD